MSKFYLNTSEGIIMINDVGGEEISIGGREVVDAASLGDIDTSFQWKKLIRKGLLLSITPEQAEQLMNAEFTSDQEELVPRERESIIIDLEEDLRANAHDHEDLEVPEGQSISETLDSEDVDDREALLQKILQETGNADVVSKEGSGTVAVVLEANDSGATVAKKKQMSSNERVDPRFIESDYNPAPGHGNS